MDLKQRCFFSRNISSQKNLDPRPQKSMNKNPHPKNKSPRFHNFRYFTLFNDFYWNIIHKILNLKKIILIRNLVQWGWGITGQKITGQSTSDWLKMTSLGTSKPNIINKENIQEILRPYFRRSKVFDITWREEGFSCKHFKCSNRKNKSSFVSQFLKKKVFQY